MTKKIMIFIFAIVLFSCKNENPQKFATISGKITNHLGKDGFIQSQSYKKTLKISKEGVFSDTLQLNDKGELFTFSDGNEFTSMYLKNGDDIHLTLDTKEFDETIIYKGKGSENNNYLAQKSLLTEKLFSGGLFDLDENEFKQNIKEIVAAFTKHLKTTPNLDANLVAAEENKIAQLKSEVLSQYKEMKAEKSRFSALVGKSSPSFDNYENYKGGTTSLKDLQGKYVYIDVWATWCGPCKAEIPYLQELEKKYHTKNIAFVSISVDNGRGYKDNSKELSKKGWRTMIVDKKMSGIQLFADKAWKSDFIKGYKINSIPRFILIDPKGNIVDANASRPSSPKTKELFNNLLK